MGRPLIPDVSPPQERAGEGYVCLYHNTSWYLSVEARNNLYANRSEKYFTNLNLNRPLLNLNSLLNWMSQAAFSIGDEKKMTENFDNCRYTR